MDRSSDERTERLAVATSMAGDAPAVGIDLDGTIDEAPEFLRVLSHLWPGKVYVITWRDDRERARKDVERFGVRYDDVILVNSFAEKAAKIRELGITVYVDDQDEVLQHIPEGVTVLKIRNDGNFEDGKWLYSGQTGQQV